MSTSTISPHPCFSVGHSLNSFPKMLDHGVIHERLPFHHLWGANVMSCHPGDRHPVEGGIVYGSILPTAYSSPLKIGHLKRKQRILFQPSMFRCFHSLLTIRERYHQDVSPGPQEAIVTSRMTAYMFI